MHRTPSLVSLRSSFFNYLLHWQRWHTTLRTIPWPLMPWLLKDPVLIPSLVRTLTLESVLNTVLSGDRLPTLFSSCFALSVNNNMLMRKRKWKSINKCFPKTLIKRRRAPVNWVFHIKVETKEGIHSAKLQRIIVQTTYNFWNIHLEWTRCCSKGIFWTPFWSWHWRLCKWSGWSWHGSTRTCWSKTHSVSAREEAGENKK